MADFPTYRILSSLLPPGGTGTATPFNATLPVTLTLSDGTTVTVCDQKVAALGLMEHMRVRKQWFLQLSDDVFVISIDHTKMLFCENNLTLQKFNSSYNAIYTYGQTLFNHRTLSQQATLYEALLQSGQLFRTTTHIDESSQLTEVNAVLVDWNWPNTRLLDMPALRYEADAPLSPHPGQPVQGQ